MRWGVTLMRHFGDLSIRHKLTALFMAISGFTALAVSCPMAIYEVVKFKQSVAQNLAVVGDVLAGNSTAAITFHDAEEARKVLRALRAEPNVTRACIYTSDGKPFATYARDAKDAGFMPPLPQARAMSSRTIIWCSFERSCWQVRWWGRFTSNPIWNNYM